MLIAMRVLAGWCAVCVALGACSSSGDGNGGATDGGAATGGSDAAAGTGGSAGSGGSAGTSGSGGSAGTAGASGSAGAAGMAGAAGASPTCSWQGICSDPTLACDPRTGQCTAFTCSSACDTGQYCELQSGTCKPDPCVNVTCTSKELCDPDQGTCVPLCPWGCPQGQFCNYDTGFCMIGTADAALCGSKPSGSTSAACPSPIWDRVAPTPYDGQRGADVISGDLVLWADSGHTGSSGPATGVSQPLSGDFDVTVDFADYFGAGFDDNLNSAGALVIRLESDGLVGSVAFSATSSMYLNAIGDESYSPYVACQSWGGSDSSTTVTSPEELVAPGASGSVHFKRTGDSYTVDFDCDGHKQTITATWVNMPVQLEIALDPGPTVGPCSGPNFVRIPDVSFTSGSGTSDTFDCDSVKP